MDTSIFEKLHAEGIIADESLQKVKAGSGKQLFSLHWELKTFLYLGVILLSGGIGILIYKNIDTLGHQVILLMIAAVSAGCFIYCFKKKPPFSRSKCTSPNSFFDYILLLGCLTFVSFVGYLQFQYIAFGNRYGLATFIPMLVLFFSAYYFDHLGILSLAVTNLAAWAGLAISPLKILGANDFNSSAIIITGLVLGPALIGTGIWTKQKRMKAHFEFTYSNFGANMLFISCLAAMFYFDRWYLLWFVLLAAIGYFFYQKAMKEKSFYFLLILSLYCYIGLSTVVLRLLFDVANLDMAGVYLALIYFIASAIGIIFFLIGMNRKMKTV
jgi:hypothetical protein